MLKVLEEIIVKEDIIVKFIDFGEVRENVLCFFCDEMGFVGIIGYMDFMLRELDCVGYILFMGDVFSFVIVFVEFLIWRFLFEVFGVLILGDVWVKLKVGERLLFLNVLLEYVRFIVESCWCVDYLKWLDFRVICLMF